MRREEEEARSKSSTLIAQHPSSPSEPVANDPGSTAQTDNQDKRQESYPSGKRARAPTIASDSGFDSDSESSTTSAFSRTNSPRHSHSLSLDSNTPRPHTIAVPFPNQRPSTLPKPT